MTRTTKLAITLSILAVVLRFILIDQPYIDRWSWRQSDVAAIARNFANNGFRFAYPQIDWAGSAPGYVGTEFPILPFVAAICYKFAGVHEWIGRSQAVIFFAFSLPFFFLLVREIFGSTAAVWATFFYSFAPLNIFAGRSFMPDVPSLSLSIIGLYFFLRWIDDSKLALFLLAAIATSVALLIKLPTAVIGAPVLFLAWRKWRWNFLKRPALWLFAAIALLPSVAWYWHAHFIAERFYPHHLFGEGGLRIESLLWYWDIARQTATSSSLDHGAYRFVGRSAIEVFRSLLLVADWDASLYRRGWLRQSPSMVSTAARADRCSFCRCRLRIDRIENLFFA